MKNIQKHLLLTFTLLCIYSTSFGQASATATATATIITPISITKTADMNFGNVAVTAASGTVVMTPAAVRSLTGGVTLPATTGAVTAASFTVSGEASYTYAITLPTTHTITSGVNNMTVNTFTSTPSSTGTLSSATPGVQTLNVGATLVVGGSQASGVYQSATPFTVTVNYN